MLNNEVIFRNVLDVNKNYVDAIARGAGKEEQEDLLANCRFVFKSMVLDAGLANDFAEFCANLKEA